MGAGTGVGGTGARVVEVVFSVVVVVVGVVVSGSGVVVDVVVFGAIVVVVVVVVLGVVVVILSVLLVVELSSSGIKGGIAVVSMAKTNARPEERKRGNCNGN